MIGQIQIKMWKNRLFFCQGTKEITAIVESAGSSAIRHPQLILPSRKRSRDRCEMSIQTRGNYLGSQPISSRRSDDASVVRLASVHAENTFPR